MRKTANSLALTGCIMSSSRLFRPLARAFQQQPLVVRPNGRITAIARPIFASPMSTKTATKVAVAPSKPATATQQPAKSTAVSQELRSKMV